MLRRDITKREKIRKNEETIDKQLLDAGFDVQGIGLEEKKAILSMLEESRKSAEDEENQRKQLLEKEEMMMKETLNMSSHTPVKEGNSNAALPNDGDKADYSTRSGSTTPDLPLRQPESPIKSSGNSMVLGQQSPRVSEDLFMFSQNSTKIGVDENVIKKCIETIKVSESEDENEDQLSCTAIKDSSPVPGSCSPSVKTQTPSKEMHPDKRNTKDSCRSSLFSSISPVKPRPSIRRFQSEDDALTSESKLLESEEECHSSSQPSLDTKMLHVNRLINDQANESIISPIVGQRRLALSNDKLSMLKKSKDADISLGDKNKDKSQEESEMPPASPTMMSDEEASETEMHLAKRSSQVEIRNEALLSLEKKTLQRKVVSNGVKRKFDVVESDEVDSKEQDIVLPDKLEVKKPRDKPNFFPALMVTDSEESSEENIKRGENINVFSSCTNDVILERKFGKHENPKKAYFRNCTETHDIAYKRILNMINQYFVILETHQKTLSSRMPWPAPIKVDKRVKDSLDPPKASRRQIERPQTDFEEETSRMVTRHSQQKNFISIDEELSDSSEAVTDVGQNNGMWLDARKKNLKRRAVQLGLSRKMAKPNTNRETEGKKIGIIGSNDICDLEDFDLPDPSISKLSNDFESSIRSIPQLSPAVKQKDTSLSNSPNLSPVAKGIASGIKHSKVEFSRKSLSQKMQESRTNFDIGEILLNSQEGDTDLEKDNDLLSKEESVGIPVDFDSGIYCQPSTSGLKNVSKRPRKTFSLNIDTDVDFSQNTRNAESKLGKSQDSQHSKALLVKRVTKGNDRKVETMLDVIPKDHGESSQNVGSENINSAIKLGKSKQVPIKPGPLRLRGQRGKDLASGKHAEITTSRMASDEMEEFPVLLSPVTAHEVPDSSEEVPDCDEDRIQCPLCLKHFPSKVIEEHASDCTGEVEDDPVPAASKSKGNRQQIRRRGETSLVEDVVVSKVISKRNKRERTPPHFARCIHCSSVVKEGDEYLIHVQDCQKKAVEEREENRTLSCPGVSRRLVPEVSSVFDHLEGNQESPSQSPFQSFVPISKQTDSLIDYKNQFRGRDPAEMNLPKSKHKTKGRRRKRPSTKIRTKGKKRKLSKSSVKKEGKTN